MSFSKYLGRKDLEVRAAAPAIGGQTGLLRQVVKHGIPVPPLLGGHLRQEERAVATFT